MSLYVQFLNMSKKSDQFEVLRKIRNSPDNSQRKMAKDLGFSLGKLNYCIKELRKKGLIKIKNFKKNQNKINSLQYILTPKGINERMNLTLNFMKRKMKEYDELKHELQQDQLIRNDKKNYYE